MTKTTNMASARWLVCMIRTRPWRCLATLAIILSLAFTWTADLNEPWNGTVHAGWRATGLGDAAYCIRFRAPPHDPGLLYATNSCEYRVTVGYCLNTDADLERTVLVRCRDGRMNICGAAPGKQCHGGMQLRTFDRFTWGACRNGIDDDDPQNFQCH